ncbi:hypothetical protein PHSC3_001569 [Chlamydiales bacterium STE3]|nr:hypothetical protein PHSC3_001569 [Chlamydiales bacterium STE3]
MASYSSINNYKYLTKNKSDALLDFLSFPLRTALGGRTIEVLNKHEEIPTATKRIINFVISFVFFPVAIIGAICLVFKGVRWKEKTAVCSLLKQRKHSLASPEGVENQNKPLNPTTGCVQDKPIPQEEFRQGTSLTLPHEKPSFERSSSIVPSQRGCSSISPPEFDRLCNEPYEFYQEIEKVIKNKTRFRFHPSFHFLKLCLCAKMNSDLRLKLEKDSIKLLKQTHPARESTISVVSVGAGGLYQELVYLAKLAKAGYKHLRLIAIDPALVSIGALDGACKDLIPAKITIDDQYTSLENYIQKATQDKTLHPDLLLLIDLTDSTYNINSQLLSDYAFDQFYHHDLLKQGTVVSHSVLEQAYTKDAAGKIIKVDFIPKAFSGLFTPEVKSLSAIGVIHV